MLICFAVHIFNVHGPSCRHGVIYTSNTHPLFHKHKLFPFAGIYGTHSSSWNPSERTFTSYNQDLGAGKNYDMFQVQSLDSDNITRVLSPVALRSRKPDFRFQINLVNGPRNTGICTGYACNERPACYFMLIATGK